MCTHTNESTSNILDMKGYNKMDKMKFETANITQKNIDKIATLFPNCITQSAGKTQYPPEGLFILNFYVKCYQKK